MSLDWEWPKQWDPVVLRSLEAQLQTLIRDAMANNRSSQLRGLVEVHNLDFGCVPPFLALKEILHMSGSSTKMELMVKYSGDAQLTLKGLEINLDSCDDGTEASGDSNHMMPFFCPFEMTMHTIQIEGCVMVDLKHGVFKHGTVYNTTLHPQMQQLHHQHVHPLEGGGHNNNTNSTSGALPDTHGGGGGGGHKAVLVGGAQQPHHHHHDSPPLLPMHAIQLSNPSGGLLPPRVSPSYRSNSHNHRESHDSSFASSGIGAGLGFGMGALLSGGGRGQMRAPRANISPTTVKPKNTSSAAPNSNKRTPGSTFYEMASGQVVCHSRRLKIQCCDDPLKSFSIRSNFDTVPGAQAKVEATLRFALRPVIDYLKTQGVTINLPVGSSSSSSGSNNPNPGGGGGGSGGSERGDSPNPGGTPNLTSPTRRQDSDVTSGGFARSLGSPERPH